MDSHPDSPPPAELSHEELDLIAREAEAFRRVNGGRDPQLSGCALAFVGMVLLTLTPALGSWIEIPRSWGTTIFATAAAALFGGAAVALVGSGLEGRRNRRERDAALRILTAWGDGGGDRVAALRAAVRFVLCSRMASGPRRGEIPSPDQVRELGSRGAELVAAVDRRLLST